MATAERQRILIATDGSPAADAALATASKFPWPASAQACAVIARFPWLSPGSQAARAAFEQSFAAVAEATRRTLKKRWRTAEVVVVDKPPVDAILSEAKRYKATIIVLGWRGHGTFKRMLTGSVSRAIASRAECPVLVVRAAPRALRRFIVGFDGCPNAERAIDFLCSLQPRSGSRATLVNVVEPVSLPASLSRVPAAARTDVRREAVRLNAERNSQAEAILDSASARLERCRWQTEREVRTGSPLDCLVHTATDRRADVLVLGARGVSGIRRALLGSVAQGALDRSPIPVLIVK